MALRFAKRSSYSRVSRSLVGLVQVAIVFMMSMGLFCVSELAVAGPLTENESQALQEWLGRQRFKGPMLTPLLGKVDQDVQKTRELIKAVVENLAGEKLRKDDFQIVINVYANEIPNAWVQEITPKYMEKQWAEAHPGEVWPIRRWLGFSGNTKSVYEVAFTTGMLHTLKTVDELAAVTGHELTHLFEGHLNEGSLTFREELADWWQEQIREAVADEGGIRLMVGKYELDAVPSFLSRLLKRRGKRGPGSQIMRALEDGAAAHHHPGVRISIDQFVIEELRRSDPRATKRPMTELPAFVRISKANRPSPAAKDLNEKIAIFLRIADEFYLKGQDFNGYMLEAPKAPGEKPEMTMPLWGIDRNLTSQDKAEILYRIVKHIEGSGVSKQKQINAFLRYSIHLGGGQGEDGFGGQAWAALSQAQLFEIERFLVKGSSGPDGWRYVDFVQSLDEQLRAQLELQFFQTKNSQKVFSRLMQVSAQWRPIYASLVDRQVLNGSNGELDAKILAIKLINLLKTAKGPLVDAYQRDFLSMVSRLKSQDVVREEYQGFPMILYAVKMLFQELDSAEFIQDVEPIRRALEPHRRAWEAKYIRFLERMLSDETYSHVQLLEHLKEIGDIVDLPNLSPASEMQLRSALLRLVTRRSLFVGLSAPVLRQSASLEPAVALLLSRELVNSHRSSYEKMNVFKFLAWHQGTTKGYEVAPFEAEFGENLKRYVAGFNQAGLLELITWEPPSLQSEISRQLSAPKRTGGLSGNDELSGLYYARFGGQANALRLLTFGGGALPASLQTVTFDQLKQILSRMEISLNRGRENEGVLDMLGPTLQRDAGVALVTLFMSAMKSAPDLASWAHLYERVMRFAGQAFELSPDERSQIEAYLQSAIEKMEPAKAYQWLLKASILKLVRADFAADRLVAYVERVASNDRTSRLADRGRLAQVVQRVLSETKMKEKRPELFLLFRNKLLRAQNVQPAELKQIFPEDQRSNTEKFAAFATQVRALSALVSTTQDQKVAEQVQMIDFLMGRASEVPAFVLEAERSITKRTTKGVSLIAELRATRVALNDRLPIERSFAVNSILTGPDGLLEKPEGLKFVKNRILSAVSPANRDFAEKMMNALFVAEGFNKSLFISYVFAQKPSGSGAGLDEALVMKSLIDAYGSPTVKLAQYLVFTDQFSAYRKVFESYQDAAMPISYYDALVLINKRLGDTWDPSKYRIVDIRGTGSMNIAIEYEDRQTGRREILNILREEIEAKMQEDFRRFNLLLEALTSDPADRQRFEMVIGLMGIVRRSVSLELDKRHAFLMQKSVQGLYNRQAGGWTVRTVDAFALMNGATRIGLAQGTSAVKVLGENPEIYREALRALYQVEFGVLRGIDQTGKPTAIALIANPDLHDGQVLIDAVNRVVTFIDFGQALEITNAQREFAIDLLGIVSGGQSSESAARLLEKWSGSVNTGGKSVRVNRTSLAKSLAQGDRMSVFVHLISQLSREGFELPLASLHWVLAANRLTKLGEKIGIPAEKSFRNLVLTRKAGLPVSAYNFAKGFVDRMSESRAEPRAKTQGLVCRELFGI